MNLPLYLNVNHFDKWALNEDSTIRKFRIIAADAESYNSKFALRILTVMGGP